MTHLNDELSAYLDGELPVGDRARVEAHLAECAACSALLEQLRRIVQRARTLDDRAPARDLWSGIAARLAAKAAEAGAAHLVPIADRLRRRVSFTVPQLAAAAVALTALTAGTVAVMLQSGSPPAPATAVGGSGPTATAVVLPSQEGVASYDAAILELERVLATRRATLDSVTVRVIEQSLALIDRAIAQARAALASDPNNLYLNDHLQRALDRKLDVLRRAVTLAVS